MAYATEDQLDDGEPVLHVILPWQEWAAWRKAAGHQIDPQTAEVKWRFALTIDPYDVVT